MEVDVNAYSVEAVASLTFSQSQRDQNGFDPPQEGGSITDLYDDQEGGSRVGLEDD